MTAEVQYLTTKVAVVGGTEFDLVVAALNLDLCFAHDIYYYVANLYYYLNKLNQFKKLFIFVSLTFFIKPD